jgi:iron complex transport system substrate-binding protein
MPHYKRILFPPGAWRVVLTVLLTGLLLAGLACRAKTPNGPDAGATRQVVDEGGRSLIVPAKIDRVVSLAPNLTEVVFAVGAGDKLVGVTSYCDYPEAARKIAKVGDTIQPNIEAIVALHPQIVLVSTSSQLEAFVQKMREQNIAVYVTDPHDLEGIFRTIANVGDLLGVKENATRELEKLRARASVVEAKVKTEPPVSVFFQLSREPLYTIGKDAYVTDLIRRAGGESVTRDVPGAFPTYSAEAALAARPEAIVMTSGDSMGGKINARVAESLLRSPAVVNGRVYEINGDLLSRPGPRTVDGVEQMAKALHPNLF